MKIVSRLVAGFWRLCRWLLVMGVTLVLLSPIIVMLLLTHESRELIAGEHFSFLPQLFSEDRVAVEEVQAMVAALSDAAHGTTTAAESLWHCVCLWYTVAVLVVLPCARAVAFLAHRLAGPLSLLLEYSWAGLVLLYEHLAIPAGRLAIDGAHWASPHLQAAAVEAGRVAHELWLLFLHQDPFHIAAELSSLLALLLLYFLARWMANQNLSQRAAVQMERGREWTRMKWRATLEGVKRQSKVVAAFLPHFLLAVPAAALLYFLPDLMRQLSTGWTLLLASTVIPLFSSARALEHHSPSMRHAALMYWGLLAIFTLPLELAYLLPGLSHFILSIPYRHELAFLFLLWLQLPVTNGVTFMYSLLVPLISKYVKRVPTITGPVSPEQRGFVLKTLTSLGLISQHQSSLAEMLFQNLYLVVGLVFAFTPGFLTHIGCLFVGLAAPIYLTVACLARSWRARKGREAEAAEARGRRRSEEELAEEAAAEEAEAAAEAYLLKYWMAYTSISFAFSVLSLLLSSMPLWSHIHLAWIMALQLPGFRGCERLYDAFSGLLHRLSLLHLLQPAPAAASLSSTSAPLSPASSMTRSTTDPPAPPPPAPKGCGSQEELDESSFDESSFLGHIDRPSPGAVGTGVGVDDDEEDEEEVIDLT